MAANLKFRADNKDRFKSNGSGKTTGYRRGVQNGPNVSTARGRRKAARQDGN